MNGFWGSPPSTDETDRPLPCADEEEVIGATRKSSEEWVLLGAAGVGRSREEAVSDILRAGRRRLAGVSSSSTPGPAVGADVPCKRPEGRIAERKERRAREDWEGRGVGREEGERREGGGCREREEERWKTDCRCLWGQGRAEEFGPALCPWMSGERDDKVENDKRRAQRYASGSQDDPGR